MDADEGIIRENGENENLTQTCSTYGRWSSSKAIGNNIQSDCKICEIPANFIRRIEIIEIGGIPEIPGMDRIWIIADIGYKNRL